MMANYHAVSPLFWTDVKVRGWSEDARHLALYLLTCPSKLSEGFYRLPEGLALDELRWSSARFSAALDELAKTDFIQYDADAQNVLILKALKYNAPRRGNHTKGSVNALEKVQDSPELFDRFLALADRYAPEFAWAIRDRYGIEQPEGAETPSWAMPEKSPPDPVLAKIERMR
jgi:hypothetical protein